MAAAKMKDMENNNTQSLMHNTSNSSEDNSEGKNCTSHNFARHGKVVNIFYQVYTSPLPALENGVIIGGKSGKIKSCHSKNLP